MKRLTDSTPAVGHDVPLDYATKKMLYGNLAKDYACDGVLSRASGDNEFRDVVGAVMRIPRRTDLHSQPVCQRDLVGGYLDWDDDIAP